MKKIITYLLLLSLLSGSCVLNVYAKPSQTAQGNVIKVESSDSNILSGNIVVEFVDDKNSMFIDVEADVKQTIDQLNSGNKVIDSLDTSKIQFMDGEVNLADYNLLTKVEDLVSYWTHTEERYNARNITVTWEVPNLSENVGEVLILYYSTIRKKWCVFKPDTVDYDLKTITATFPDLCPVTIIYKPRTGSTLTPKTGDSSNLVLYVSLASASLFGMLFILKKKKTNE